MTCLRNATVDDILTAQANTRFIPTPISVWDDKMWQPVFDGGVSYLFDLLKCSKIWYKVELHSI